MPTLIPARRRPKGEYGKRLRLNRKAPAPKGPRWPPTWWAHLPPRERPN